jgi:hypothetical protein
MTVYRDGAVSVSAPPAAHDLAGAQHNADTLADLNAKVSDATLATDTAQFKRDTATFKVGGAVAVGTEQGGAWEAPAAGAITRAVAYRKSTAGTGGSTIIDININGTTIFTTQSNRPSIAFDDADGKALAPAIEAGTLAAGDMVTVDVDQIDTGGAPSDLTVEVTVEYSA